MLVKAARGQKKSQRRAEQQAGQVKPSGMIALPGVADVVCRPGPILRVWVAVAALEVAVLLGRGVHARDAELKDVVNDSSVRMWQCDSRCHIVRSFSLKTWRGVVKPW